MKRLSLAVVSLLFTLGATAAFGQELLEHVVVRNRLYDVAGRFEVGPSVGFSLVNELTSHYNLTLDLAYDVTDTVAIELRGGYAISSHTGLSDQIAAGVQSDWSGTTDHTSPGYPNRVDDMSNLWEMKANGILGFRWAPLYGKISLLGEVPVHFQAYLWVGGGAGTFHRQSVVECLAVNVSDQSCASFKEDNTVKPIGSAAFGMRFFVQHVGALKLEVRNYAFPDSYVVQIDRNAAARGTANGTPSSSPGFTDLLLFDVGYTFLF